MKFLRNFFYLKKLKLMEMINKKIPQLIKTRPQDNNRCR